MPRLETTIAALLAILESRLDRGELTLQDPIVALASDHIDEAVARGLDRGYRKQLDAILISLAPSRMTQRPAQAALAAAERYVVPAHERRRRRLAAATERRSGREPRRFRRFASPVLLVWINGRAFRTIDWSIGDVSLPGQATGDLLPGREVLLRLRVEGIPGHVPFEDRAVVVRADGEAGRISLRFKSGTTATLKVLELLSRRRMAEGRRA